MEEQQARVIRGTDLKFLINIECSGFSMDDDDFYCVVTCGKSEVTIPKAEMAIGDDGFLMTVKTDGMSCSAMYLTVHAFVPDEDFADGYREEIERAKLCYLTN